LKATAFMIFGNEATPIKFGYLHRNSIHPLKESCSLAGWTFTCSKWPWVPVKICRFLAYDPAIGVRMIRWLNANAFPAFRHQTERQKPFPQWCMRSVEQGILRDTALTIAVLALERTTSAHISYWTALLENTPFCPVPFGEIVLNTSLRQESVPETQADSMIITPLTNINPLI